MIEKKVVEMEERREKSQFVFNPVSLVTAKVFPPTNLTPTFLAGIQQNLFCNEVHAKVPILAPLKQIQSVTS